MLHAYNYVGNSPVEFSDPGGLWWEIPVLLLPPLLVVGAAIYCEIKCSKHCKKLYPVISDGVSGDANYWKRAKCMADCQSVGTLGLLFGSDPLTGAVQAPSHPH